MGVGLILKVADPIPRCVGLIEFGPRPLFVVQQSFIQHTFVHAYIYTHMLTFIHACMYTISRPMLAFVNLA
jgi:hypothetical protein